MRNPWKLTTFALAAALTASVATADPQPKMRDALGHLRAAADSLKNAAQDKGGHRVKALELTNAAITQVEKGIKFDNRH